VSIKTNFEIPRAIDENDIVKQGQRTAQDLSKNFKAIKKELSSIAESQAKSLLSNEIVFSGSYSITVSSFNYGSSVFTFTHGFNVLPSGFVVVDLTSSNTVYMTDPVVTRVSWTTTQITVRISTSNFDIVGGLNHTQSGTFKIMVLR